MCKYPAAIMSSLCFTLTLLALLMAGVAGDASFGNDRRAKQISIPKFEYDPDTTRYCSWWIDNDGGWTCDRIETELEISMIDFLQWNPSVELPCSTLPLARSFCVAAAGTHYEVETLSATPDSTSTTTETITARLTVTTKQTPVEVAPITVESTVTTTVTETLTATTTKTEPTTLSTQVPVTFNITQPTTVLLTLTATSPITETATPVTVTATTTTTFRISVWSVVTAATVTSTLPAQLSTFIVTAWSGFTATVTAPPSVSVSTFVATAWSVVTATVTPPPRTVTATSTVRATTTITPPATTRVTTVTVSRVVTSTAAPTVGRNGIPTPVPFQPEMVGNCQTFYFVRGGDTCESIGARHRLAPEQIVAWNPGARRDCTMLLADYYACVGVS